MLSIPLTTVQEFALENLRNPAISKNGYQFDAVCPFCGDSKSGRKKRRFGIRYRTEDDIRFNCFNCGETGNFVTLYAHMKGITTQEAYKELRKFDPEATKKRLKEGPASYEEKKIDYDKEKKSFNWIIRDCLSVKTETKSHMQEQLQQRLIKFKKDRKIKTPVFVCWRGLFSERFIIPIIEGRKVIYFQGRAMNDSMVPKYLNPEAEKEAVIQNKENFDKRKSIVMTEGILDGDAVGNQGTAILGATISDQLITELSKHTDHDIILAADNDERGYKELNKIEEKLKLAKKIRYFLMPPAYKLIKDLNELKVKHGIDDVYSFVVENSYGFFAMKSKIKIDHWRKHAED